MCDEETNVSARRYYVNKPMNSLNYLTHRGYHMATQTEIQNFSLSVEKYFSSELREQVKYFSTQEENLHISKRLCNILSII